MIKLIFGTLISMITIIVVMFGQLFGTLYERTEDIGAEISPRYHIQLFTQDTNEYFWTLFQEGVYDASREFSIYPEFINVAERDIDELEHAVEMGINAGVDALALTAVDSNKTQELIEYSEDKGVSIITYENDNYLLPNAPVVGTNSYSLGYMAGEMAIEVSDKNANVILIIPDFGEESDLQYKNMIVQGVLEAFSKYSTINLLDTLTINSHMFEAERLASTIINEHQDVDLIICMDERSTPGVAQSLVDNNLVGDINLVGYGLMPQTIDYIKKGVIYGTVYPDAYQIGYEVVSQLYKALEGEQISEYVDTDLYAIDFEDLEKEDYIINKDDNNNN